MLHTEGTLVPRGSRGSGYTLSGALHPHSPVTGSTAAGAARSPPGASQRGHGGGRAGRGACQGNENRGSGEQRPHLSDHSGKRRPCWGTLSILDFQSLVYQLYHTELQNFRGPQKCGLWAETAIGQIFLAAKKPRSRSKQTRPRCMVASTPTFLSSDYQTPKLLLQPQGRNSSEVLNLAIGSFFNQVIPCKEAAPPWGSHTPRSLIKPSEHSLPQSSSLRRLSPSCYSSLTLQKG